MARTSIAFSYEKPRGAAAQLTDPSSRKSVRELFIIDVWSDPEELVHVGTLFPNLTSLELDYASDWIPLNNDAIAGLSEGLLSLSGTLERKRGTNIAPSRRHESSETSDHDFFLAFWDGGYSQGAGTTRYPSPDAHISSPARSQLS
ncbi:unnamed protein product, partial [Clonostachys rhizophaga]